MLELLKTKIRYECLLIGWLSTYFFFKFTIIMMNYLVRYDFCEISCTDNNKKYIPICTYTVPSVPPKNNSRGTLTFLKN